MSHPKACPESWRLLPATSMAFRVLSGEGDVMPSHFFTDGYISLLSEAVRPWIDHEQDSGPRHIRQNTKTRLSENFVDDTSPDIWPPS